MNFKKTLLIISLFYTTISISQIELKRDLTTSVLDTYFKDAVGTEHKFKSTLEGSLNWEIEMLIDDMTYEEFSSKNNLKESAKDLIYTSLNSAYRIKIYQTLTEECDYKYILFKVSYITEEYKKTSFMYSINMKELLRISNGLSQDNLKSILHDFKM